VRARRVVVLSPDRAFAAPVAAALSALSAIVPAGLDVVVRAGPDALEPGDADAAVCVVHCAGELARAPGELLARLPGGPVIAALPGAGFGPMLELMQAGERVAGVVVVADGRGVPALAALAARLVGDDVFGLSRVVAPGTEIVTEAIGDHRQKTHLMTRIDTRLERAGVPRGRRDAIDQCLDEMLMNALYDAPVDAQGRHVFAGVPVRTRITLRTEQQVTVEHALEQAAGGGRFAVAVRDVFGSLERATVLRHLQRGHAQQMERKAGGAGLGLYLMAHASAAVYFHVLPGIATEVICVFELGGPRAALRELGFLVQQDAGGRVPAGPALALPAAGPRRGRTLAVLAAVAGCGLAAALAWPRVFGGPGAGSAAAPAPPTVELDSEPSGAEIELDGQPVGATPLTLTDLAPGKIVSVAFKQRGYRTATARLAVPAAGAATRLVQPLTRSDEFVRVRFVSQPPGAEVLRSGQAQTTDRTYTPTELFVEAGVEHRFVLTMPRHVPLVLDPFTPARGDKALEKGGALVPGAPLRIEATLPGAATVAGAPHCTELPLPATCTLAPGRYTVAYVGPDGARVERAVTIAAEQTAEETSARFALGVVEAAPGKLLLPGGVRRLVLEAGTRTVTVAEAAGATGAAARTHKATVRVEPGATVVAQ